MFWVHRSLITWSLVYLISFVFPIRSALLCHCVCACTHSLVWTPEPWPNFFVGPFVCITHCFYRTQYFRTVNVCTLLVWVCFSLISLSVWQPWSLFWNNVHKDLILDTWIKVYVLKIHCVCYHLWSCLISLMGSKILFFKHLLRLY